MRGARQKQQTPVHTDPCSCTITSRMRSCTVASRMRSGQLCVVRVRATHKAAAPQQLDGHVVAVGAVARVHHLAVAALAQLCQLQGAGGGRWRSAVVGDGMRWQAVATGGR